MAFRLVYLAAILILDFNYLSSATILSDLNETNVLDIISSSGINFAFNVYRQLGYTKNLFFSPISLSTTLSMAMQGAQGQSLTEMRKVLQYNPELSMDLINSGMNQSIRIMKDPDKNCVLNLANGLYVQNKMFILPNFLSIVNKYYQGSFKSVNFKKNIENAKRKINKWVFKNTKGKIPTLFTSLESSTRLILVNAIYFSGPWNIKFAKVTDQTFNTGSLQVKSKMMLLSKVEFKYAEDVGLKCKILELPYKGKTFSMLIILPNEIDGLQELEKVIDDNKLKSLQSKMTLKLIDELKVPKFKLNEEYDMIPVFRKLGLETVFNSNANFSAITTKIPLKISQIVHKAIIEVNEHGSQAAAATGIAISSRMHHIKPATINFIADHPFMFIIWNKKIENILFIGRVQNP